MKRNFIVLLVFLIRCELTQAQSFSYLDTGFATQGKYIGDTGGCAEMVVQPDGKIVIAGGEKHNGRSCIAMRINGDGSVDTSFGDHGYFTSDPTVWNNDPIITSVCLQPDGKIVLGGLIDSTITGKDFLLMRLNPVGIPDSSFGGVGYVTTAYTNNDSVDIKETLSCIALQSDGKIVAYGSFSFGKDTLQVVRYQTSGAVDSSFGVQGRVKISEGIDDPLPNDVAVMPDGRIVMGATADINSLGGATSFAAIRLLYDGSLDTSFNHIGIAYTNANFVVSWFTNSFACESMCLQSDGKVLLGGHDDSIAVVRFDTSGNLDNTFGRNGLAKVWAGGKTAEILQQPDNSIVMGAYITGVFPIFGYLVIRMLPDGRVDSSFGYYGLIPTGVGGYTSYYEIGGLALQSDGKLLAGTTYSLGGPMKLLVVRYNLNGVLVSTNELPTLEKDIFVYPNPANDYISIQNDSRHHIRNVSLYSIDGKLLRFYNVNGSKRLSIDGLVNGVYYLRINLDGNYYVPKKVVVQRE